MENAGDILTKPLPWYKMKIFVEPLLLWKGDTNNAPVPSEVPEGSNTLAQRSGTEPVTGAEVRPDVGTPTNGLVVRNAHAVHEWGHFDEDVPPELYGNQYAVLYDQDEYTINE